MLMFSLLKKLCKDKFAKKTYHCVFIGYSYFHKGYQCLNPETNKVYISRHVVFDEQQFSFKTSITHAPTNAKSFLEATEFLDEEN